MVCINSQYFLLFFLKVRPFLKWFHGLLAHNLILHEGDELLGIKSGEDEDIRGIPNQHFTFIFNLVVIMSLFNEINCRKIDGSLNMFAGIHKSFMFVILWSLTFTLQVLKSNKLWTWLVLSPQNGMYKYCYPFISDFQVIIVEFGGFAFFTAGLSLEQWMWCIFFGISGLLLALASKIMHNPYKRAF